MKNIFLLAMTLMLSCTIAFAQSSYAKGEALGKTMAETIVDIDEDGFTECYEQLVEDIRKFSLNDDKDSYMSYFEGFAVGTVKVLTANGYSEDDAFEFLEILIDGLTDVLSEE